MNDVFEALSEPEQQRLLDRLVDGEISHHEQRQLILSLEGQPDGWRRCALAFLEAQTWGREFRQLTDDTSEASPRATVVSEPASRRANNWLKPLAVAVGFVLAFTLGIAARSAIQPGATELALASTGVDSNATASQVLGKSNSTEADPTAAKYETVKVSLPASDGNEQTLELPLIEADQKSLASIFAEEKSVLSDLELKTLQSTGHQVEQRRAYYPVQLQDGRRAVLPMDLVEVKYTGGWQ